MDRRDEQLAFLAKHATNSPPTASPAPLGHAVTRAIIKGIGPALKKSFAKLHAENQTLKSEIAALKAERAGELAQLRADVMGQRQAIIEAMERFGIPTEQLTAVPRRLS